MYTQNSAALGMHDLESTHRNQAENLFSSELVACLFTGSKHKGGTLEMAAGKGRSKGGASLGLSGVSAHRENWGLAAQGQVSDTYYKLLLLPRRVLLILILYVPAVIGQRK